MFKFFEFEFKFYVYFESNFCCRRLNGLVLKPDSTQDGHKIYVLSLATAKSYKSSAVASLILNIRIHFRSHNLRDFRRDFLPGRMRDSCLGDNPLNPSSAWLSKRCFP